MPEFLLRYSLPKKLSLDWEIEKIRQHAIGLAKQIEAKASEIFFGWQVIWEVREFGDCGGQPDFSLIGWITDDEDKFTEVVLQAQAELLAIMQSHIYTDQTVHCSWRRTRGKWGSATGLIQRPKF